MSQSTRHKILNQATQSFNEEGYQVVSLQLLAQKLEMSRGNLTYHFKSKDLILEALVEEMWQMLEPEMKKSRAFPSFKNLLGMTQIYYKIQERYSFIFLDHHVINHPVMKNKFREINQQMIDFHKAAIAFAIRIGNVKEEPIPGMYHNIAFITWMLSFYWLSQRVIRGETMIEDRAKMVWSILIPHFTEKGLQAFKDYFGEEYYQNLGEAFSPEDYQMIML